MWYKVVWNVLGAVFPKSASFLKCELIIRASFEVQSHKMKFKKPSFNMSFVDK